MSSNSENVSEKKTTSSFEKSFIFQFTLYTLISAIVIFTSFAIYPLLSAKTLYSAHGFLNLKNQIVNYIYYQNASQLVKLTGSLFKDFSSTLLIGVLVKNLIIFGAAIWGIVSLKKGIKKVLTPLYCLIAYLILEICLNIADLIRMARILAHNNIEFEFWKRLQWYFTDYHTITAILFIVVIFLCIKSINKYFKIGERQEPLPTKDISGIGGWMIIPVIRNILYVFNYAVLVLYGIMASAGNEGIIRNSAVSVFSYLHWELTVFAVLIVITAVIVVIKMFKKDTAFRPMAIALEGMIIYYNLNIILYYLIFVIMYGINESEYWGAIGYGLFAILWSIMMVLYYLKSERVKNTYVLNKTASNKKTKKKPKKAKTNEKIADSKKEKVKGTLEKTEGFKPFAVIAAWFKQIKIEKLLEIIKNWFKKNELKKRFDSIKNGFKKIDLKPFFKKIKIDTFFKKLENWFKEIDLKKMFKKPEGKLGVKHIIIYSSMAAVVICAVVLILLFPVRYNRAVNIYEEGANYSKAYSMFTKLKDYKDAPDYALECEKELTYIEATALLENEDYNGAKELFASLGSFKDSRTQVKYCENSLQYLLVQQIINMKNYAGAKEEVFDLTQIGFKDSLEVSKQMDDYMELWKYENAINIGYYNSDRYEELKNFYSQTTIPDVVEPVYNEYTYNFAIQVLNANVNLDKGIELLTAVPKDYKNRDIILGILEAYNENHFDDYVKFAEVYFTDNKNELSSELIYHLLSKTKSLDDSIKAYHAYRQLIHFYPEAYTYRLGAAYKNIDIFASGMELNIENDSDDKGGNNDTEKMLFMPYGKSIRIGIFDLIPEELVPASLSEVKYILTSELSKKRVGTYTSGTAAMRYQVEVYTINWPSGKKAKSFGKVYGTSPPNVFSYYGAPPKEKTGQPPYEEAEDLYLEAISKYINKSQYEDFEYFIRDGVAIISYYTGDSDSVIVPDEIEGIPVEHIQTAAFSGVSENLTSITLPKGLKEIASWLFVGCDSLEEIVLPADVLRIGDSAFWGCDALRHIELNDGLISIGKQAFYACPSLVEIDIPDSVSSIGDKAFEDDTALEEVYLSANLEEIPDKCFKSCTDLEHVEFTDACVTIGEEAFSETNIFNIALPESLIVIEDNAFENTPLSEIEFPTSLEYIAEGAFKSCKNLTEIYIPETVRLVSPSSFIDEWMNVHVVAYSCAYQNLYVNRKESNASNIIVEDLISTYYTINPTDDSDDSDN